jgi:hypothetical protein
LDGYWGSENHKIVQCSNRLLLEEIAAPVEDRKIRDLAAGQIIMWCREKALRGYTEYASTHYTERSLVPLLNVHDYSIDATHKLREWCRMAIDQLLAEYTLLNINGFRCGALRRCYQTDIPGDAVLEGGSWLVSDRGFGETPDWPVFDCDVSNLIWSRLDIETIEAGERVKRPDLSHIRSIGWTDLLVGEGSPAVREWIGSRYTAKLPSPDVYPGTTSESRKPWRNWIIKAACKV